ncbi:ribose 5-phosphate isomerase B [Pectinatus haikarae]|uniref:Ribose 5-phosphate isomerase B n=1 Tax=Pectinatus haikarae TaxID=349096 RepID=A0ABT9YDK9_9FIRM|nr:ribose 5-phosphate isomerase B [Pectinatus haikarae]MDQ0205124.1 ribose 5-phosphate isomerase B [Pectinatus haikarae]
MKIAIGCDEAAYSLKIVLKEHLEAKGYEVDDFGAEKGEVVLYPDVAYKVADAVAQGKYERAVLVCGTGIGMCICANKVPGVRAAVCHDQFSAQRSRMSNNAQIICMGERVIGTELAKALLDTWLDSDYSEKSRSQPKVMRINELEQDHIKAAK